MHILPAIDLRNGKVVRLELGDYARQTQYSDSPAAVAEAFVAAGATWIHVVDLDAALTGKPANTAALRDIRQAVGSDVQIEFGGGARNDAFIETMLGIGVDRVVVGSAALKDWAWFERLVARPELAGKIALGLDARDGKLAVNGWTEQLSATAIEVAAKTKGWPLGAIVYTDISRDGMLSGINVPATAAIVAASNQAVIASGGLKDIEDVRLCLAAGCAGVIIGKAYYEGRIDLSEAIAVASS
ncbi:MAG: 1-(5-phosphoribosyl)-5-[(5-phosphoribosylamino)methylideneamino]imidazole-4-carboxamide isomerase [Planctomycetaceae bacterium]|nr:MAG: 1-(5-phosphoribosyl)-5-[(5-phosphoribosylamino)methylideneamino]imidazole-4-carboxamide isomerase [Planctomycetaceae bacterium]